MFICLEQGADLHMAQLMPLPLTVSASVKSRLVLLFWYRLTWVKRAVKLVCVYLLSTQVSQYQRGKTNLNFTEARDSQWQWHQLGHMQVCTSLQADNHASTPPLSFLQAGCPSCCPTNSVKTLKAPFISAKLKQILSISLY